MANIMTKSKKSIVYSKENSILIIGKGESEYKNREILKAVNVSNVEYLYGKTSELTMAYKEAIEIGGNNIFLCNCYKYTDYILVIDLISKEEYTYICPLFDFSETFMKANNSIMYLCEYYSNMLHESITQLIFTEKHADLYDLIENYLLVMNNITQTFKDKTMTKLKSGENICFILNSLKKYKFANVALASILIQNELRNYPQKDIGEVVFDVNSSDVYNQEITYFAYDSLAKTSIENFLNFKLNASPEKFIPVNLIKQKIIRSLDLSSFTGKLFSPYMRIALENAVNNTMKEHVGVLIENYILHDIRFVSNQDRTVSIFVLLSAKPYNSIEELNITLEV